ncbi:MAG: hypothetical protein ACHQNT_00545 [Bacteroidia bacterium]
MTLKEQLKNISPILIIVFSATTALLSGVLLLGTEYDVELDHFTQDPTAIMDAPFYTGFFSNIGILLWCASAAICFFTRGIIPKANATGTIRAFLFYSGLVTSLLMLDDLFLLHESALPDYIGIPEKGVYVIYGNILLLYLFVFRSTILKTEYLLLALAFALIGISTVVDLLPMPIPEDSFLEDAVKLFGIVSWFIYFLRGCYAELRKII